MSIDYQLVLAMYNQMTDKEKDLFCYETFNKSYDQVSEGTKNAYSKISHNVKLYINADPQQQEILWYQFDQLSQLFSNLNKWETFYGKKF